MSLESIGLQTWIWNNNLKSTILLLGFPILLLTLTWMIFAAMGATQGFPSPDPVRAGAIGLERYGLWVLLAVGVWFAAAFCFHQSIINAATGAQPLERKDAPEIYNLLENLCISRGLKTPELFIIDSPVLNAYASGLGQGSFSVTLTRGIVETLNKDELEVVIAHELTHILNRDVRLLVISIIFVGMLSFACEFVYRVFIRGAMVRMPAHRDRDRGGNGALMLMIFAILAVGYVLAILIRFSISRQREYVADAGGVELTKNPNALVSALRKISGHADLPHVPDEARQMFIENENAFLGLFATHPPIDARIHVLCKMAGANPEPPPAADPATPDAPKGPWG